MCGIVADFDPAGAGGLAPGVASLRHRGPDGTGVWRSPDGVAALGHARLAVLDLRGSPQPIASEDGRSAVVVNGEFYDHRRIRRDLTARGHRFATGGDSEIALHLYEEYGLDFVAHLRGEFALVLWDGRDRRLVAVRDRWGVKPLCFHREGRRLRIASEAKALFALGVPARWDEEALWQIAGMQYALPGQTLFGGVRQLPPGHLLVADEGGVRESVYWDMDYPRHEARGDGPSPGEAAREVRDALAEAVRVRLRADVPVCFHLSGGLDSASVVALADAPAACFTVGFDSPGYDERMPTGETARALGAGLTVVEATRESMLDDMGDAVWSSEGLAINGHLAAKYALARAVRAAGYRVVLSGEGADELFGGYAHLRQDALSRDDPALRRAAAAMAGIHLPEGEGLSVDAVAGALGVVPTFLRAKATLGRRLRRVLRDDFRERFAGRDPYDRFLASFDVPGQLRGRDAVERATYLWCKSSLATYILRVLGDGTEMAHGVEGRLPFLDGRLFEVARGLPTRLKIGPTSGKVVLRDAMRGLLPEAVLGREKQPFTAPPLGTRPDGTPEPRLRDLFSSRSFREQLFFDEKRLIDELERMPRLGERERVATDPVVMLAYTAGLARDRFGL